MNKQARYWFIFGSLAAIVFLVLVVASNGSFLKASLNTSLDGDPVTPDEVIECNKERIKCIENANDIYNGCMTTAGNRYAACIEQVDRQVRNERDKDKKEQIKLTGYQACADGLAQDSKACLEALQEDLAICQQRFAECLKATEPDDDSGTDPDDGSGDDSDVSLPLS